MENDYNHQTYNKSAKFRSIILQISALIAVVAIIVFVLNYFKILHLSKNSPTNMNSAQNNTLSHTTSLTNGHTINTASEVSSYDLYLSDKESLDKIMQNLGIWDKTYNLAVQKDTTPLKSLDITLTDNDNQLNNNNTFKYSLGFKGENASIKLYIPVDSLKNLNASSTANTAILSILEKIAGKSSNTSINYLSKNLFIIRAKSNNN